MLRERATWLRFARKMCHSGRKPWGYISLFNAGSNALMANPFYSYADSACKRQRPDVRILSLPLMRWSYMARGALFARRFALIPTSFPRSRANFDRLPRFARHDKWVTAHCCDFLESWRMSLLCSIAMKHVTYLFQYRMSTFNDFNLSYCIFSF